MQAFNNVNKKQNDAQSDICFGTWAGDVICCKLNENIWKKLEVQMQSSNNICNKAKKSPIPWYYRSMQTNMQ